MREITVQDRSTLHRVSSNIDVQLEGDTVPQRFPSLAPNEARALDQLLAHLDPQGAAAVIGLFGPPSAGKSTLLRAALEPAPDRKVRTPEHRKVVGLLLDAASTAGDLQPWQSLLLAVIDLLTSNAMPGDRKTLNDLRNELGHAIRTSAREDGGAALALAAFTHHFRGAFPRLVQNVFGLSNAVLAVGIDHLDQVAPGVAAELLEAASYFLNAPGCAVVFCADEAALVAKLDQSAPEASGQDLLRKWLTARVDVRVEPVAIPNPKAVLPAVQRLSDVSPAGTADVPPACMQIISGALQPNKHLIGVAVDNWRNGMRAVVKRAEDGLHSSISSTAMAKLVTLRALSPQLFDAARYDARMLVALERQARAGARPV